MAYNILTGSKALTVDNAQGSFYLFPRLPEGLGDKECVNHLLEHGVAVVPGSAFGPAGAGSVRLTFTLEDEKLIEGLEIMVSVIDRLAGR